MEMLAKVENQVESIPKKKLFVLGTGKIETNIHKKINLDLEHIIGSYTHE